MNERPMKIFTLLFVLIGLGGCASKVPQRSEPDTVLRRQVVASHYIHEPLPLNDSLSYEVLNREKNVLESMLLAEEIVMRVPTTTGKRPMGSPDDPDYAIFGKVDFALPLNHQNMEAYDRMTFQVLPKYEGTGVVNLNAYFHNETSAAVGAHLINLTANRWNDVCYELGGLPREDVSALHFYSDIKGKHATGGDTACYIIRNVRLERTGQLAKETGWMPQENQISYSTSGYLPQYRKQALLHASHIGKAFYVKNVRSGKKCVEGTVVAQSSSLGEFGVIDFSALREEGMYQLTVGEISTQPFPVSRQCFESSAWRVLNFIFCQRCGDAVKGIHGVCHTDLFADFRGKSYSYGGGWHDAGDLSQQTLQTADVAFALLEAAERFRPNDAKQAERLTEEALWGLKFVLQCRLGEGYHASSLGLLHWTDNEVGTFDDIHTVRKQNHAFDNFLYAAYEAYACRMLGAEHPLYAALKQAAEEDFRFASTQYAEQGILPYAHIMEHTYNTPPCIFTAVASWASTQLYLLTDDSAYAQQAVAYIRYTLACQEREGSRAELKGFFYRDEGRKSIVHFIHQSREQLLAVALVDLCKALPTHRDFPQWREAITLYANYMKSLMPYTAPYFMASSGTYAKDEYLDREAFASLHIFAPADAAERYTKQLSTGGIPLDDTHYVKRFPVWFNIFNGNEAIILSIGKAAAKLGEYLKDEELKEYGLAQLYWTVGRNPFSQSLIYGEGSRYPSMDSFSSGEIVGEIPVGIRSWEDTDEPYWPQTNNACYKEVWLTSAGKWLSLIAEY